MLLYKKLLLMTFGTTLVERTDTIMNEVLEPITFVPAYRTVFVAPVIDFLSRTHHLVKFSTINLAR